MTRKIGTFFPNFNKNGKNGNKARLKIISLKIIPADSGGIEISRKLGWLVQFLN